MTANTTPDAESFENAVIELLGLEVLTKDKISPFDIAQRFYYRGVADASPSVERTMTITNESDHPVAVELPKHETIVEQGRLLPELPEEYFISQLADAGDHWYCYINPRTGPDVVIQGFGPTPRAAVLNALKQIGGAG